jgi:hypothetical protein
LFEQRDVLWAWNVALEKTGGYLFQRILLAVINSSLMLIVMLLAGIPFAVPLAGFTGFTATFIPIVGTNLAGIVPVVVALAPAGPARATSLLAWIVIYHRAAGQGRTQRCRGSGSSSSGSALGSSRWFSSCWGAPSAPSSRCPRRR